MSSDSPIPSPPPYDEKQDDSSLEKGKEQCVVQTRNNYQFDVNDLDQVQRKLKQRHVQMIAVSTPHIIVLAFSLMRPRLLGLWEQVFSSDLDMRYRLPALLVPSSHMLSSRP